ncbi:MAG: right-handed parallel beta-helix repeat-containing protein [Thermoguttaceae bacterium]|jgi:hypothetical protein
MRNLAIGFLLAVLVAGPAGGRDLYVDNRGGDDQLTGTQPRSRPDGSGPLRTLTRALHLAGPGDHIRLADSGVPYRESISLVGNRLSGTPLGPLVLDGNGAVLDGSLPVPADQWVFYRDNRFRFRPPRIEFYQLFLDSRPAVRVFAPAASDSPPKLQPRQWCAHQGAIYFAVEPSKLPADYALRYACLPTGITLYHVDYVVIRDLTIQGFQIDGLSAANTARRITLKAVTSTGNGRSGLAVGGASQVDVDGCLLRGNGTAQLLTLPYSEVHLRGSRLPGDTAAGWVDQGGRVYLEKQQIRGGREAIQPQEPAKVPAPKDAAEGRAP